MHIYKLVEFFSQGDAVQRREYVPRPSWWDHYEVCLYMGMPPSPVQAYFGSTIADKSRFAGTIWAIALSEFATMVTILSLQIAKEGVTWASWSNDPTFSAHGLYPVVIVSRLSKHLIHLIRVEIGVAKIVEITPYTTADLEALLVAPENHSWYPTKPGMCGTLEIVGL